VSDCLLVVEPHQRWPPFPSCRLSRWHERILFQCWVLLPFLCLPVLYRRRCLHLGGCGICGCVCVWRTCWAGRSWAPTGWDMCLICAPGHRCLALLRMISGISSSPGGSGCGARRVELWCLLRWKCSSQHSRLMARCEVRLGAPWRCDFDGAASHGHSDRRRHFGHHQTLGENLARQLLLVPIVSTSLECQFPC
jgi:hypothetical protein